MPVVGEQIGITLDRIILATDYSPAAEKAAGYARGLAKRFTSSLTLANVVNLSAATRAEDAAAGLPLDSMRQASAENQELLLIDMTSAGVRTTAHTMESHNPSSSLVGFAKELRADLIVTGTNARHGLSKALLGSCSEGIIRHADCPVLTVGPKARAARPGALSFQRIVFATDFSPEAARQAAVAFGLAKDGLGKIYICHVLKKPGKDILDTFSMELQFESALENLVPRAAYEWCDPECIVESGEVASHILSLASRVGADLIVLGAKHSATWFAHLVDGTVGEVLKSATCPVLTVGEK